MIFGDEYKAPDGNGQRDDIHMMNQAEDHLRTYFIWIFIQAVISLIWERDCPYRVKRLITAFERVIRRTLDHRIEALRNGELLVYYAIAGKAKAFLG